MKIKRLLVTLGMTCAFTAALASCGLPQEGDSNFVPYIQKIDLSDYENSFYQKNVGKPDTYSAGVTYKEADVSNSGATYFAKNVAGEALDPAKVDGLKAISYKYYNRTNGDLFSQISTTSEVTGLPKQAGEYWCELNFTVDENRYEPIEPWYAKVNVYKEAQIKAEDFKWDDRSVVYDGLVHRSYATITLNGETIELTDETQTKMYEVAAKLPGIKSYSYTTTLNKNAVPNDVSSMGSYEVKLTLVADNAFLPSFVDSTGSVTKKLSITEADKYSVTYDNGGHGAPTEAKTDQVLVTELPTLTEPGYTFEGWYYSDSYADEAKRGQEAKVGDTLAGNCTLVAKWTQTSYNVTYVKGLSACTQTFDAQTLQTTMPTLPTVTAVEGYTFKGWYTAAGTAAVAGAALTADATLYAKWEKTLESGAYLVEDFADYTDAASIGTMTVAAGTISSAAIDNGALKISMASTKPTMSFKFNPEDGVDYLISFDVTLSNGVSSNGYWSLLLNGTRKLDARDSGSNGTFTAGIRNGSTEVSSEDFIIDADHLSFKVNIVISGNTASVTYVRGTERKTFADQDLGSAVNEIRFGNTDKADVTIDNLVIAQVL